MSAAAARLTLNLIQPAVNDLAQLQEWTGLSKTDLVNRALQLYAFVEKAVQDGGSLVVRDSKGNLTAIKVL
jgi:hypothetical protein